MAPLSGVLQLCRLYAAQPRNKQLDLFRRILGFVVPDNSQIFECVT